MLKYNSWIYEKLFTELCVDEFRNIHPMCIFFRKVEFCIVDSKTNENAK